jgi:CheY-like chemotaxis protein
MLEDLGHTAIAADSGAQALEILNRATRIDLLVTDQVMPDMTGIQLAGIVRETWPQIPIIIANEYGEMPREAQGRYVTLSKPFFRHDLYKALCHTFP